MFLSIAIQAKVMTAGRARNEGYEIFINVAERGVRLLQQEQANICFTVFSMLETHESRVTREQEDESDRTMRTLGQREDLSGSRECE